MSEMSTTLLDSWNGINRIGRQAPVPIFVEFLFLVGFFLAQNSFDIKSYVISLLLITQ